MYYFFSYGPQVGQYHHAVMRAYRPPEIGPTTSLKPITGLLVQKGRRQSLSVMCIQICYVCAQRTHNVLFLKSLRVIRVRTNSVFQKRPGRIFFVQ